MSGLQNLLFSILGGTLLLRVCLMVLGVVLAMVRSHKLKRLAYRYQNELL